MKEALKDCPALLTQFDRVSNSVRSVGSFREAILGFAVRGKLVAQNEGDEPVNHLVERIRTSREKLVNEGTLRNGKPVPPIDPNEVTFKIPEIWRWQRFGNLVFNRDGERIPVSKIDRAERQGAFDYYGASGVIDTIDDYIFDKPLLLIGEDGANLINRSTPIAFIAKGKYWVNNHAHVLDGISHEFLCYLELFINAIDLKPYVTGAAQPKMNQAKMNSIPVALPPVAEQKRIVAKVEELMGLCDQLEAAQTERERQRDRLNASSLHRIATASNDDALRSAARFHFQILPRVTVRPDQIAPLRQTILAVRGKLVKQDEADGGASEILRNAGVADIKWMIDLSEQRFELPVNWIWTRFGGVGDQRLGKMLDKAKNTGVPTPYLRNTNVQWCRFVLDDIKEMRLEAVELEKYSVREGDLLICEGGEPGRCAIWPEGSSKMVFQKALHRVRPWEGILSQYLLFNLWLDAQNGVLSEYFTGTGIKHFTGVSLAKYPIPLPPLTEQHRIVAKVDELMSLCDQLETSLTRTQTESRRLLDAVMAELTKVSKASVG